MSILGKIFSIPLILGIASPIDLKNKYKNLTFRLTKKLFFRICRYAIILVAVAYLFFNFGQKEDTPVKMDQNTRTIESPYDVNYQGMMSPKIISQFLESGSPKTAKIDETMIDWTPKNYQDENIKNIEKNNKSVDLKKKKILFKNPDPRLKTLKANFESNLVEPEKTEKSEIPVSDYKDDRGEIQIIDGIQDLSNADKELIQENIYQAQDKLARAYGGREAITNIEKEDIADIHDVIVEKRIGREMAMKGANSRVDDEGRITTLNDRTFDAEEFTNKMIQAGEKFQGDCSVKMAPPGSYEPVPLLSFPGCGNTWARHLIEKATGIYTGSVYHDGGLYNHGHYRGEMEHPLNGTTIVQKVHRLRSNQYSNALFRRAEYCIFLIRDPRKAFISEYTRLVSHNHIGVVTASIFKGEEWERKASTWANIGFPDCYSLPLQQNSCSGEIKYVFYEDLRKVDLDEDY